MLELDRESPLFDAVLGVRVCSDGGLEEGERLLTVRLLSGSRVAANTVVLPADADPNAKHRGRERLLHLELCDGQDPYFLYSLDVGEGDFHELRREHGLLVDFGSFPRHFIELLGRCTGEPQDDWAGARFGAALDKANGKFGVVEANRFKQVTHLSLRVAQGDDASVKAYLAGRLEQTMAQRASLEHVCGTTKTRLEQVEKELSDEKQATAELEARLRQTEADARGTLLAETAQLRETYVAELETARSDAASELRAVQEAREREAEALKTKSEDLAASLRTSQARVAERDAALADLEARLATLKERTERAESTLDTEKGARANAEAERDAAEAARHSAELRLATARQRAEDADAAISRADALRAAAERDAAAAASSLEKTAKTLKRRDDQLVTASSEIKKGNALIDKLSDQTRAAHAKLRLKTDLAKQLERRLDDIGRAHADDKHKRDLAEAQVAREHDKRLVLEKDLDECRKKLVDAAELLENNQQVIQYLNAELNEHQLGRRDYYVSPKDEYQPPKNLVATTQRKDPVPPTPQDDKPSAPDPAAAYFQRYADDSFASSRNLTDEDDAAVDDDHRASISNLTMTTTTPPPFARKKGGAAIDDLLHRPSPLPAAAAAGYY